MRARTVAILLSAAALSLLGACHKSDGKTESAATAVSRAAEDGETHLRAIRQLTFAGENAEAYFSRDGEQLIYQTTHGDLGCDQIFIMGTDGSKSRMVSTGKGRTTCAYFLPDGSRIVYASTHLGGEDCPPQPPREGGYVWPIYASYDVFSARPDGTDLVRLTDAPGYDAEATIAPDGSRIVYTSVASGDLELWLMDLDGGEKVQVTDLPGYDGGAFFSPDSKKLCYRASRPETPEALQKYRGLLAKGLVEPGSLELFVVGVDGTGLTQVTSNGAANFCPFFHPSGEKLIFASNLGDPAGRNFDLYLINLDGTGLEQVTRHESFDGFPMFSPDGKQLVWGANRHNVGPRDTNVFIAEWVD